MATKNRASLINHALKILKKHFKPTPPAKDRSVLDTLLVACCAENSSQEAADRAFETLKSDYFDWNEVRVSTVRELAEAVKPLNDPEETATRLKRVLQSVFETHYSFDLEAMRKQNIGAAVKQIEKYNGSTPFTVAYVVQHGLGGHSIPVSPGLLESLRIVGIVSDSEAAKGQAPGLERAVAKSKGVEAASLLHQLGVEMHRSPLGPTIRKLLLEIDPDCKDRLPKRAVKEQPPEPARPTPPQPPAKPATKGKTTPGAAKPQTTAKPAPAAGSGAKKAPSKKAPAAKSASAKKPVPPAKKPAKKPPVKKVVKKAAEAPKKKKPAGKSITKRKPR
ncbi:MAG: hypothetical protein KF847_13235 [Pirellulales bacterium]|nr:hypothetical protein [Pirellulales bacterium]